MIKQKLQELKEAVREWISTLSIEELIGNRDLVQIYELIEARIQIIEARYV